jgi:hypothetical protein
MKARIYLTVILAVFSATVNGQGVFSASNVAGRTRLGSIDGPLAGTNILGQMLGGSAPDSLMPVGILDYHRNKGVFAIGQVAVPGIPAYSLAYVQLVAWDSTLWGATLAGVPVDQLGRTDIVTVLLTTGVFPDPTYAPPFTQPAIVPIPEPSVWVLGVLAAGLGSLVGFARHRLQS